MVRHTASSQFSSRISSNEESPSIHPPLSLRSEKNRKEDHLRGASSLLLPLPWIFEPINLDDRRERIDNGERACVFFNFFRKFLSTQGSIQQSFENGRRISALFRLRLPFFSCFARFCKPPSFLLSKLPEFGYYAPSTLLYSLYFLADSSKKRKK